MRPFVADADALVGGRAVAGRHALEWLLFARLALCVVSFGIALALETLGRASGAGPPSGLYWILAFAFLATALSGLWLRYVRRPQLASFAALGLDVAIVTGLVGFSGGYGSVFSFLYLVVTLYGAILVERRGALVAAGLSSAAYGAVLFAGNEGLLGEAAASHAVSLVAGAWAVHVSGLFLVGALAGVLVGELRRTGAALDRSTDDLRRLHDLHRRTVDSILSGLLTLDPEGRVTSLNPEGERITQVHAADVIGWRADALLPGVEGVLAGHGALGERDLRRVRLPYVNPAGEDLFLGLAASILRDAEGRPAGHILIFTDVTNVVEMESQLRQSERLAAVGEMAAKMAHEIRNPLAAISGSVQVLQRDLDPAQADGEAGQLMEIVVSEAQRLGGLIEDFLTYAQPRPLRREFTDLGRLCRDVAKMADATRAPGVDFELNLEEGVEVAVDQGQLRQVVWNLMRNAMEAVGAEGTVAVSARAIDAAAAQAHRAEGRNDAMEAVPAESRWAEIAVRDTGPGITREAYGRLFEPFFTTKEAGTGLGLATVHRIVEGHGGTLMVDRGEGRGARIAVRLPWVEPEA